MAARIQTFPIVELCFFAIETLGFSVVGMIMTRLLLSYCCR